MSIRCRLCNMMILSCKPTYVIGIPQIELACVEYEKLLRHLSLLRARKTYQMGLSFEVLSKFPSVKPEPPHLLYQWSNVWLDFQRDSFKQSNQIMITAKWCLKHNCADTSQISFERFHQSPNYKYHTKIKLRNMTYLTYSIVKLRKGFENRGAKT